MKKKNKKTKKKFSKPTKKAKSVNKETKPAALALAKKQREISVAEFFEKNRHLLGFDNKRKALLTTIKEAVDNALDACEEARILPELVVDIVDLSQKEKKVVKEKPEGQTTLVSEEIEKPTSEKSERFRIIIEDNGPGIVKSQIPNIFAKLLYGSKFHTLKMARGQQGIGISAAALYAQLTTGRPIKIKSKISPKAQAHYYELRINTQKNEPEILSEKIIEWKKDHGTKIEIDLVGAYQKGGQSVDRYLKQTAIVNPHSTLIYTPPDGKQIIFARVTEELPRETKEIRPHPYGVELGRLIKMLQYTKARTLQSFLMSEFSRVGAETAKEICRNAALLPSIKPTKVTREMAEKLEQGIQKTKIIAPPTDCISPIGAELLEKGLKKEVNAEFYTTVTRPPSVYRGNPFIIEVGIAYGGEQQSEEQVKILRFANRVPLLYQQSACSITKSIIQNKWRNYGLSQSRGALPVGPCTIVVHIASVWVPFTSESKEAIAHYPEIIKEMKLALQECGRKLNSYIRKKKYIAYESQKRDYISTFIPHIGSTLKDLLKLNDKEKKKVENSLRTILEKKRGKLEEIEAQNIEFDKEFALEKEGGDGEE